VSTRVTDVACPGCGCVCDDLTLTVDDGRLVDVEYACTMGEQWFQSQAACARPAVEIDGRTAAFEEALTRSVALLRSAQYPLVYGLSRSATPGQRAAIALAERIGAAIDTTASLCHGPSIMAMQDVGEVTCTLGEVRNRADLVIFWGCHPAASHPRHAERYSVFPSGRFTPAGRAERTVVMVGESEHVHDWRLDPGGARADLVIPIEAGRDFETLSIMRCMLHGDSRSDASAELRQLVALMKGCRYGVVFFGLGLAGSSLWDGQSHSNAGHVAIEMLLTLVAELNLVTRFSARRMRLQGDVSGADSVLCWHTGFPFAVDLSRGYPRYNPGEFTANELLERGDTDLCLLLGAETVPYFSPQAQRHLQEIPTILLDYPSARPPFTPSVSFTTAVYGVHAAGTIYRMDNIPVPLRSVLSSELPTDEAVLTGILSRYGWPTN
jgi:formylmethanofuran dehydrogenase subunit B